jgi:anti-sigma-K factor RskA
MAEFEQQLARALERHEPGVGFTSRVLAAAAQQQPVRSRWRAWRWVLVERAAPVMAALLVVAGGVFYQKRERTERGEAAKQQLLLAVKIAGAKLHDAQQRVVSIGEIRGAGTEEEQ